ncbi:hypothetical protein NCC49_004264 [Naganishia albida]|nr:hypothetical protein NCC49_004264 [Naganishia albida]
MVKPRKTTKRRPNSKYANATSADGLFLNCQRFGCEKRYDKDASVAYGDHKQGCRVHTKETEEIENTISDLAGRFIDPLIEDTISPIWSIASREAPRQKFHIRGILNPYDGITFPDPVEVQEFNDTTLQIDDLIDNFIRDPFGIPIKLLRLYLTPSTGKRGGIVHNALATVVNDLICRELLPEFSYQDFWDYSGKTKKYTPLTPDEAKDFLHELADEKPRVNAQCKIKKQWDIYDHHLTDILEHLIAQMYHTTVSEVQDYITRAQSRTRNVDNGKEAMPSISLHAPVGAMLIFTFWVKSQRHDLSKPIGDVSSLIVGAWRRSLEFRKDEPRFRDVIEEAVQRLMDMDAENEDEVDLILDPKIPEDPIKAQEQAALRQEWISRLDVPPRHSLMTILKAASNSMEVRERVHRRGNTVIGGYWTTPEIQRSLARACIEMGSLWPAGKTVGFSDFDANRIARGTRIGKHFGAGTIQRASLNYRAQIIECLTMLRGSSEDSFLDSDMAYLDRNFIGVDV